MTDKANQILTCEECSKHPLKFGEDGICEKCGKELCYDCWCTNHRSCEKVDDDRRRQEKEKSLFSTRYLKSLFSTRYLGRLLLLSCLSVW